MPSSRPPRPAKSATARSSLPQSTKPSASERAKPTWTPCERLGHHEGGHHAPKENLRPHCVCHRLRVDIRLGGGPGVGERPRLEDRPRRYCVDDLGHWPCAD